MKEFMTFVWILIFGAAITGCTTFNANENGLRRVCKSGVSKYDDGSLSFECSPKDQTNAHSGGSK